MLSLRNIQLAAISLLKRSSNRCLCDRAKIARAYTSSSSDLSSIISKFRNVPRNSYPLLLLPCITLYLGLWQIKRRKWKLGLIDELDRKRKLPGVELPCNLSEITKSCEYEPFILRGVFDHSKETYIGPRSLLGDSAGGGLISSSETIGAHVITPLKLSGRNEQVLVNRGWISMKQKRDKNSIARPEGEVNLIGIFRVCEQRSSGANAYDSRTGMWAKRDVSQLSQKLGTNSVFFDQADTSYQDLSPGSPIPGQTLVQLRNEHLSYIVTWFSLTVLMLLIWCNRYLKSEDRIIKAMIRKADQLKSSGSRKS